MKQKVAFARHRSLRCPLEHHNNRRSPSREFSMRYEDLCERVMLYIVSGRGTWYGSTPVWRFFTYGLAQNQLIYVPLIKTSILAAPR